MPIAGLEPTRIAPTVFETAAFTSFTISAHKPYTIILLLKIIVKQNNLYKLLYKVLEIIDLFIQNNNIIKALVVKQ